MPRHNGRMPANIRNEQASNVYAVAAPARLAASACPSSRVAGSLDRRGLPAQEGGREGGRRARPRSDHPDLDQGQEVLIVEDVVRIAVPENVPGPCPNHADCRMWASAGPSR